MYNVKKLLAIFLVLVTFFLAAIGTFNENFRSIDHDADLSTEPMMSIDEIAKPLTISVLDTPEIDDVSYLHPYPVADPLSGRELYDFFIDQIHEQYYPNVPTSIVRAVMTIESNYTPGLTSSAGAVGLMQLIPKYHAWRAAKFGLNDLNDPYTNIICAVDFLNEQYERYGRWDKALLRYNNSTVYVDNVLSLSEQIAKEGG